MLMQVTGTFFETTPFIFFARRGEEQQEGEEKHSIPSSPLIPSGLCLRRVCGQNRTEVFPVSHNTLRGDDEVVPCHWNDIKYIILLFYLWQFESRFLAHPFRAEFTTNNPESKILLSSHYLVPPKQGRDLRIEPVKACDGGHLVVFPCLRDIRALSNKCHHITRSLKSVGSDVGRLMQSDGTFFTSTSLM